MRIITRISGAVVLAVLLLLGAPAIDGRATAPARFDACPDLFPGAVLPPARAETQRDLCKGGDDGKTAFAVRHDTVRQTPAWVAYRLTTTHRAALMARDRPRFRPDAALPAPYQARDDSYTHSGYSRGHLVPAHDMSWSIPAFEATFDLSNTVPQKQFFNAGTWLGLENAVRDLSARHGDTLWIIAGVYGVNADRPTLGRPPHTPQVPACFFKIVVAPTAQGRFRVLAALFEYDDARKRAAWRDAVTTLTRVRRRTGVGFLTGLALQPGHDAVYWGVDMPKKPGDCAPTPRTGNRRVP